MKKITTYELDRCDVCGEKIPAGIICVTTSPSGPNSRDGYEFLAHETCYDTASPWAARALRPQPQKGQGGGGKMKISEREKTVLIAGE